MSSSSHRLSTVYDYTSLRIHPDGSRVNQSSHNLRPRIARVAVQDARGNWIARDAGGSATVKRYTTVRDETSDGESFDFGDVEADNGSQGKKRKGKAKDAPPGVDRRKRNGRSAAKRQKFMNDFEFLATPQPVDGPPLPSSDLLKCIHHFASTYYNERGQLFNGSREFRQQRKMNKLKKLQQEMEAKSASTSLRGTPEADTSQVEEAEPKKPRRGGRVKGAGKVIHRKDMYKVMDGSALVVLGMLLQEYVADMLEVRIPEGWEESVRNAYRQAHSEESDEDDSEDSTDDMDVEDHDYTDMEDDEDIHSAPSSMPPDNFTEAENDTDEEDDEEYIDEEDPEDDSE